MSQNHSQMENITINYFYSLILDINIRNNVIKRIGLIESLDECKILHISDLLNRLCTSQNSVVILEAEALLSKNSHALGTDSIFCLELISCLERSDTAFQREMIYRALKTVLAREPDINQAHLAVLIGECRADVVRYGDHISTIRGPFEIELPASGESITRRLAEEVLTEIKNLANFLTPGTHF